MHEINDKIYEIANGTCFYVIYKNNLKYKLLIVYVLRGEISNASIVTIYIYQVHHATEREIYDTCP